MPRYGAENHNWSGGRTTTQHGYVLIRVGKEHHLSDVRGYAYEHRIIAEQMLGRLLKPNEKVHHVDGNRKNNTMGNIVVINGNHEHYVYHRKNQSLRLPNEPNPIIKCQCGCNVEFKKYDRTGRPRKFVSGHNPKLKGKFHAN